MFALADCDNFFVSCERIFRPELNGKPVIVLSNNDGCAVARSNEAKALGIKMGDPLFKLKYIVEKNDVAVFSSNFALYSDISKRVQNILMESAPNIEVYSIDEAFLDLRGLDIDFDKFAKGLSAKCRKYTAIPVSVGVAPTKTLAKIASKLCKKYPKLKGGCYMHRPEDIEKVLHKFPVEDVWGIGRHSAKKLQTMGVKTAWDYTQISEMSIRKIFALPGLRTWKELRGIPTIEFKDMIDGKHSICVSRSFAHDITDIEELSQQIANFAESAVTKLRQQKSVCFEMIIYAFTNQFKENAPRFYGSHLVIFPDGTNDRKAFVVAAVASTKEIFKQGYGYKKAGVVITKLKQESEMVQTLFADTEYLARNESLNTTLDSLNATFGEGTVRFGAQGDGKIKVTQEHQSPHYTTRWSDIPTVTIK